MEKKNKLIKVYVTPEERRKLVLLASGERSVSAFIRKQMFGQKSETTLRVGRIHSDVLQIARAVVEENDTLSVMTLLAYMVAIERELYELVTKKCL